MLPSSLPCSPGKAGSSSSEQLWSSSAALRQRSCCWWLPVLPREFKREDSCWCRAEGRLGHWSRIFQQESTAFCTCFLAVPILSPEGITRLLLEVQEGGGGRLPSCRRDRRSLLDTQLSSRFVKPGLDSLWFLESSAVVGLEWLQLCS